MHSRLIIFCFLFCLSLTIYSQTISIGNYQYQNEFFSLKLSFLNDNQFEYCCKLKELSGNQAYLFNSYARIEVIHDEVEKASGTYLITDSLLVLKFEKYAPSYRPEYIISPVLKADIDSISYSFKTNQRNTELPQPGVCVMFYENDSIVSYGISDLHGCLLIKHPNNLTWDKLEISYIGNEKITINRNSFEQSINDYSIAIYLKEEKPYEVDIVRNDLFRIVRVSEHIIALRAFYLFNNRMLNREWFLTRSYKEANPE